MLPDIAFNPKDYLSVIEYFQNSHGSWAVSWKYVFFNCTALILAALIILSAPAYIPTLVFFEKHLYLYFPFSQLKIIMSLVFFLKLASNFSGNS